MPALPTHTNPYQPIPALLTHTSAVVLSLLRCFTAQAYFSVLTSLTARLINIEFASSEGRKATFYENGKVSFIIRPGHNPFRFENLQAELETNRLMVSDGKWDVVVTSRVQIGINATSCRNGR
jgi:hypothetical protein